MSRTGTVSMPLWKTLTFPSDPIRIIGGIYGVPYDDKALFFNGLRCAYTDYTDFFNTHP
jgi:hypothetical protein